MYYIYNNLQITLSNSGYNIYIDPDFLSPAGGDFQIGENSPCIDAGYYLSPFDPDCTITDLGAFYYDQSNIGVIVDGYCYLDGQSNHAGTQVLFQSDSISGVIDSTYTYINGYYQIVLNPDIYDIFYTHLGFEQGEMLNQACWSSMTLPDITLYLPGGMQPIYGSLNGVLASGAYLVQNDIWVDAGASLTIEAGCDFMFYGNYGFEINGYLSAVGNEEDSISFVPYSGIQNWQGIRFTSQAADSSMLKYCLIMGACSSGVKIENCSPTIERCRIYSNQGEHGGGIKCYYANPIIRNCDIIDNNVTTPWKGGGIYCDHSNAYIESCTFTENNAIYGGGIYCNYSEPIIIDCYLHYNSGGQGGGGIALKYSNAWIIDCLIKDNYSYYGGGIYCTNSNPIITSSIITGNSAWFPLGGGGIRCSYSNPIIRNCVFTSNLGSGGGGITCSFDSQPNIANCIFAYNYGTGVYLTSECSLLRASFCDLYGNPDGAFGGPGMPPEFGIIDTVNIHGDSCDIFFNIMEEPLFADTLNGDFHLQSSSPCIDAGDFCAVYNDEDGTINDMGAYGGGHILPLYTHLDYNMVGTTRLRQDTTWNIYNSRSNEVVLTAASFEKPEFYFSGVNFPVAVEPFSEISFNVHFQPTRADYFSDSLIILCEDLYNADYFAIQFEGTGINTLNGELPDTLYAALSPYYVMGDISVGTEESTFIEAGVVLLFDSEQELRVSGALEAVGSETDTIKFVPVDSGVVWEGIHFDSASACGNQLEYCLISGSQNSGISLYYSDLDIRNSLITENQAESGGGGIRCDFSTIYIENCIFHINIAESYGGALYFDSSNGEVNNCYIEGNESGGYGGGVYSDESIMQVYNTVFNGNITNIEGGGWFEDDGYVKFNECTFSNNQADYGGGIYSGSYLTVIENTTFTENTANDDGAACFISPAGVGKCEITRCIIAGNTSLDDIGGIRLSSSVEDTIVIENCTFHENSAEDNYSVLMLGGLGFIHVNNCIFSDNMGDFGVIYFQYLTRRHIISYSDFNHNENSPFYGNIPDSLLGINTRVNANGDSCDRYFNIFLDPLFQSTTGDSAYFLTRVSPCIDAGNPTSPLDPDSTIADIGAFYYDQTPQLLLIEDLTITIDSVNIILQWSPVPDAESYNIYRSTEPYFDINGMIPIATTDKPTYIDLNALIGNSYFYRVNWE